MTDPLEVEIYQGRDPALAPAGAHVVIDVLRAFTTAHVAFERGCSDILLADSVDRALELANRYPERLLVGERDARRVEGFDVGNSPTVLSRLDIDERGVVQTTTNGTRTALNALGADHVLVAGWSSTPATLHYLRDIRDELDPRRVNLVASHPVSDEDLACAEYLAGELGAGNPPPMREVVHRIRSARSAQKFYSTEFRLHDLDLACRQPESRYVMGVGAGGAAPAIEPIPVSV